MPVTTGQVTAAIRGGLFEEETIRQSDMTGGQFNTVELGTSENGVLAEIEVGADPPIADAEAVIVSQFLGSDRTVPTPDTAGEAFRASNTRQGPRIECRLRTSGNSDAQASAKFGVGAHKDATINRPNVLPLTPFGDHDPNALSGADFTQIPVISAKELELNGGLPVVTSGEFITHVANPGSTSKQTYQFDEASAEFKLPILKWDGRGV